MKYLATLLVFGGICLTQAKANDPPIAAVYVSPPMAYIVEPPPAVVTVVNVPPVNQASGVITYPVIVHPQQWQYTPQPTLYPTTVPGVTATRPFPAGSTMGTTVPLVVPHSTLYPGTTGTVRIPTHAIGAGAYGDINCTSFG